MSSLTFSDIAFLAGSQANSEGIPLNSYLIIATRVSSEAGFDYLRIFIREPESTYSRWFEDSGNGNWQDFSTILNVTGTYSVRIVYEKDSSVDGNNDTAWIDDVVVVNANTRAGATQTYYSETFESGVVPDGWVQNGDWGWGIDTSSVNSGTYSLKSLLPQNTDSNHGQSAIIEFDLEVG